MSNPLHDLLVTAAEPSEPGFDAGDVERRVHRRRTRRRVMTGGAAVLALVLVGATAGVLATGDDDGNQVVAASDPDAALTADDLVGDRWVLSAVSEVMVLGPPLPWVEFGRDGTLRGSDGCLGFSGGWSLDGRRLRTDDLLLQVPACPPETPPLVDRLDRDPTVDRFDGGPDTLKLSNDDGFIAFRRLGTIGRAVSEGDLAGGWTNAEGEEVLRFEPNFVLFIESCGEDSWALDDSRLIVPRLAGAEDCLALDPGDLAALFDHPRLRLEGDILYLASDDTVTYLDRAGAGDAAATTTTVGDGRAATFDNDPRLRWSVVAVEADDVLNVRDRPDAGAAVVGSLDPGTTGLLVSDESQPVAGEEWRQVLTPGGVTGWANGRYLAAQPREFGAVERGLAEKQARSLVAWARGEEAVGPEVWLSDDGLWVGGLGVYADAPTPNTRIPAAELADRSGWTRDRTFDVGLQGECGECTKPLLDFLGFDTLRPDRRYLVDEVDPGRFFNQDGPVERFIG
ncbi:MAG: META domain-containing protein, partial [Actinomycetota bacterium]|nr:META domain-containing protein [Actinomycetota bacterium]